MTITINKLSPEIKNTLNELSNISAFRGQLLTKKAIKKAVLALKTGKIEEDLNSIIYQEALKKQNNLKKEDFQKIQAQFLTEDRKALKRISQLLKSYKNQLSYILGSQDKTNDTFICNSGGLKLIQINRSTAQTIKENLNYLNTFLAI